MKRRAVLLGLGASAAGGAAMFGSGAFTQISAERQVSIGIDRDSQALLGLVPNTDLATVFEQNGELRIDSDQLSVGNRGFNANATVAIGATDGSGDVVDGDEAFKVVNNFDQNLDVELDLSDDSLESSPSVIRFIGTRTDSSITRQVQVGGDASLTFEGFQSGAEILFGIEIETESAQNPQDIQGTVVFRADPSPLVSPPQATFTIVNQDTGTEYSDLDTAVSDADPGQTLVLGPSNSSYTLSQTITTPNLTIEGPNAGVAGDNDDRGSEAKLTSGGTTQTIRIDADGVEIAGLDLTNPAGSGDGDTDINAQGIRVDEGSTGVTIRDNRVRDVGTGSNTNARGVLAFSGTDDLEVSNNEFTNIDGTSTQERQVEVIQVIESNNGNAGQPTSTDNVRIENNTISTVTDARSPVGIRFNGNVSGDILDNDISGLTRSATTGFTVGISLSAGGNATSPPDNVTISGNDISNLGPQVTNDEVPPVHVFVAAADASTVTVQNNQFAGETDLFVGDATDNLDIQNILNSNTYDPGAFQVDISLSGQQLQGIIADGKFRVVNVDQLAPYEDIPTALADANASETLLVAPGAYDGFEIATDDVTVASANGPSETTINGVGSVGPDGDPEGIRVDATGVTIEGFEFEGQAGADDTGVVVGQSASATVANCVFDEPFAGVDLESSIVDAVITNSEFVGNASTDRYVEDFGTDQVDLDAILNSQGNTFNPAGTVDSSTRIVPQ